LLPRISDAFVIGQSRSAKFVLLTIKNKVSPEKENANSAAFRSYFIFYSVCSLSNYSKKVKPEMSFMSFLAAICEKNGKMRTGRGLNRPSTKNAHPRFKIIAACLGCAFLPLTTGSVFRNTSGRTPHSGAIRMNIRLSGYRPGENKYPPIRHHIPPARGAGCRKAWGHARGAAGERILRSGWAILERETVLLQSQFLL
jgi:hypothetical protein